MIKGKNTKKLHYNYVSKLVKRNSTSSLRRKVDIKKKGLPTGRMTVAAKPVKGTRRATRR